MSKNVLNISDLGRQPYRPVLAMQEKLVAERQAGSIPDTLLLVEHERVFTMGRNAKDENVLFSSEELEKQGIELVHIGRGGDVTYHGPGQLVGYPIINLRDRKRGIVAYVDGLEQVLIKVLADFDIEGTTDKKNRGVWVGNTKVAAIGVRVTRFVTMHGFALNVEADLAPFGGIIPCGIRDKGVTSLHLLAERVTMHAAKKSVVKHFVEVFGYARAEEAAVEQ